MNTAYLIPGAGEAFYCENCHRDLPLIKEMRLLGHQILAVPLYLPLLNENLEPGGDTRIFFGAIDMYLSQNSALYLKLPAGVRKKFDNPTLLKLAARFSGSTSPQGLEQMTLNMLDPSVQAKEKEAIILCSLLKENKIELIHISNALLLGLGVFLKRELNIPLLCTLQDEDTWVDDMPSPHREEVWARIHRLSAETDLFLPVSAYYRDLFIKRSSINLKAMKVIPIGLDILNYPYFPVVDKDDQELTLAYLSHQKEGLGLDTLVATYKRLREVERFSRLKLVIAGGSTSSDRLFVRKIRRSLKNEIKSGDVTYFPSFQLNERIELLKQADILSVPMEKGEAFGTYLIEAMACGVPVVQPDIGAFPEIINKTGGGFLYESHDPDGLYNQLKKLLENTDLRKQLSLSGREAVASDYSQRKMAELTKNAYSQMIEKRKDIL